VSTVNASNQIHDQSRVHCTTNLWSSLTAATLNYRIFLSPPTVFITNNCHDG